MILGEAELLKGNYKTAIEIFEPWPWAKAHLGIAYAVGGDTAAAEKILEEIKKPSMAAYQSAYEIGALCVALGRLDEGFDYLDQSYAERDPKLVFVRAVFDITPHLQNYRQHPRYRQLLQKMGYGSSAA